METMRRKKMIWIILVISSFYAIFLVIFYPVLQKLPLPFGISRWHDMLAVPVWALAMLIFFTNEKLEEEYDIKYSSLLGLIIGAIVGLVIGLFNLSLLWPVGNVLLVSAIVFSFIAIVFFLLNLITDSTLEASLWCIGLEGGFCLTFGITAGGLVLGLAVFIAILIFNVCLAVICKLIKCLICFFKPKTKNLDSVRCITDSF